MKESGSPKIIRELQCLRFLIVMHDQDHWGDVIRSEQPAVTDL